MKSKRFVTLMLALVVTLAILPAKPTAAEAPHLIPSIDIHFSETVFVTLTNVYEFYAPFGYRKSIYMGEGGTVRFNGIDGPYSYQLDSILYQGRTYSLEEIAPEGWGATSFNLGRCPATGALVFPDYMELIGGTYQWVAQLMINQYMDFESHTAALAQYGRYSLFRHTWQKDSQFIDEPEGVPLAEYAPIIESITIRPPGIFEDDDLTITFTNVYDAIGRADIMMQSAIWFYLAQNGSFSLSRDVELTSMFDDGARFETIQLAAGEVFNMHGHTNVSFHYGNFEIDCCHAEGQSPDEFYRHHTISFNTIDPTRIPLWQYYQASVSYHIALTGIEPVTDTTRTLRFVIDSVTFTDNGTPHTLEAAPFIANERTMVPLRVIAEALGATDLDLTDGVVSFVLNGETVTMTIDQPLPEDMGTPVIIAGRTFVPIRYVVDVMGARPPQWDGENRAAYVFID